MKRKVLLLCGAAALVLALVLALSNTAPKAVVEAPGSETPPAAAPDTVHTENTADTDLRSPAGLLAAEDGTLYVADRDKNQILVLQESGVTAVAGYELPQDMYGRNAGRHLDGAAQDALFQRPGAMAQWLGGIAVCDTDNHCLRLLKDGIVRTLAGTGSEGLKNGIGSQALFSYPAGLAVDDEGSLYIADSGNGAVRKLTESGQVSTYAAGFESPTGLCWQDGTLYVADAGSNRILAVKDGKTAAAAGAAVQNGTEWTCGFADGPADKAEFSRPMGLLAADGAVYIADTGNSAVRVLRDGQVATLRCTGEENALYPVEPVSLALVENTLYVADRFAGVVFTVDPAVTQ